MEGRRGIRREREDGRCKMYRDGVDLCVCERMEERVKEFLPCRRNRIRKSEVVGISNGCKRTEVD